MNKSNSASKIKMKSFDDLFGTNENLEQANANGGEIREIPLASLHTFRNHPFQIHEDKLEEMVESVRQYGVLVPGIARMRPQGGYEIIAGHTRKAACELAGLDTMPMFIRNLSDDEATIVMVDSNIQREDIFPSEKARAYSMRYYAMKHQGIKGDKGSSLDIMSEETGENAKKIQRYIRLAIVVMTDRIDLDDQLYAQFSQCADFLRQTPVQAESKEHLKSLLDGRSANGKPIAEGTRSRLIENYNFFAGKLADKEIQPAEVYESIGKLQIVNITLDRAVDDAQAIFESLNSTGKELSESDLIRNYVLMGLEPSEQTYVYEHLWRPMEQLFIYETQGTVMDAFFRHYLTMKLSRIPKQGRVYEEFKLYHLNCEFGTIRELCQDLLEYAKYYTNIVFKRNTDTDLKKLYEDIIDLRNG